MQYTVIFEGASRFDEAISLRNAKVGDVIKTLDIFEEGLEYWTIVEVGERYIKVSQE